jgi:hypothetical protein
MQKDAVAHNVQYIINVWTIIMKDYSVQEEVLDAVLKNEDVYAYIVLMKLNID